jgi:hypothetical protein
MGIITQSGKSASEFGDKELHDRDTVIQMLKWESEYMCSPEGQARYKAVGSGQFTSLDNEYAFNRMVLREFGFSTSDASVANYRRIFGTYYRSPTEYDRDVIGASHYMRNNRCVFYTSPKLTTGDTIPNVPLLTPDDTETTLYDAIQATEPPGWEKLFICAFSNS